MISAQKAKEIALLPVVAVVIVGVGIWMAVDAMIEMSEEVIENFRRGD